MTWGTKKTMLGTKLEPGQLDPRQRQLLVRPTVNIGGLLAWLCGACLTACVGILLLLIV
jgi:hypothetical protein